MMAPGDYVKRAERDTAGEYVTVTIVDMYGNVRHVTIPKRHTADGWDDPTLRAAAAKR